MPTWIRTAQRVLSAAGLRGATWQQDQHYMLVTRLPQHTHAVWIAMGTTAFGYKVLHVTCTLSTLVGVCVGFTSRIFLFVGSMMSFKHLQIDVSGCNSAAVYWLGPYFVWDKVSGLKLRFWMLCKSEHQGCRSSPDAAFAHLLPSALWGAQVFPSSIKVLGGFPVSELPAIQEADVGGGKPRLPFSFVPRPNKTRKVFLFWEKQFILDSGFLPHLGRWDNLNAVLSALTLAFLAAKLKKHNTHTHTKTPQQLKEACPHPHFYTREH